MDVMVVTKCIDVILVLSAAMCGTGIFAAITSEHRMAKMQEELDERDSIITMPLPEEHSR